MDMLYARGLEVVLSYPLPVVAGVALAVALVLLVRSLATFPEPTTLNERHEEVGEVRW